MKPLFFILTVIAFSNSSLAQSSDNIYDWTGDPTKDGLTRVEYKGKFGYINDKKQEVIEVQYAKAKDFEEGLANVSVNGTEFGLINTSGKTVIPFKYDEIYYWFREGMIPARYKGKWGMITMDGKTAIPHIYFSLRTLSEGLAIAKLEEKGKFGFLDSKGKQVIPFIYDQAYSFREGLALVEKDGKFGYLNKKGEAVIPLQFSDAKVFNEGLAGVQINGKYGFIDKNNKLVIPAIYSDVYEFNKNEAEVELNGEFFRIDKAGKRLNPGQYLMVYTKGLNMGKQYWNKSEKVPTDALHKKYQEGYRLTDYVYNQHNNEIFVTMSNVNNYPQNGISYNNTKDQLWKKVTDHFEDGYNITHVTFGNGKWSWNGTKFPKQQTQTRIYDSEFPNSSVWDAYKKGLYITSLSYGGEKWMVVMKDEKYKDQEIVQYKHETWDNEDVAKWMKKGYAITQVVKVYKTYYVVYTKGTDIKEQLLVWEEDIPARDINKYWEKGYALYRTFYVPRALVMDASFLDLL